MSLDQIASILWRRRVVFLTTLAACVATVVALTLTLPKTYKATATLLVSSQSSLVTTDLLDQLARTYSTLASNPNVADEVSKQLHPPMTRDELLSRMSFAPVQSTQLLQISAEGDTPLEAQTIANTYATVFLKRVATHVPTTGRNQADISISESASVPTSPAKPNPPLYIGLGVLLSLLIALGVGLLRERLDTRIRIAPEDDRAFDLPIMARIPRFARHHAILSREVADRFELLKTNLDFADEKPTRVVVVASPGVSEGKSTVAASLAIAAVGNGERVVLMEADLRRPGLERTAALRGRVERSDVGLTNYLAGMATEDEILNADPTHEGLRIVWSGPIPPNPTALLQSERLTTLLESLSADCDWIIIDTPPIAVGADASALAPKVDGALYVIDQQTTKRRDAQAGLNQLANVRARILGIVVNRARRVGRGDYTHYYGRPPEEKALETPPKPKAASDGRRRRKARV